jgi:hypothetical protein
VEEYGARELFLAATEEFAHVFESSKRDAQGTDRACDSGQPKYQIEVPKPGRPDSPRDGYGC